MNVLKWAFLAERLLLLEELRHALAVRVDDTQLDWENFPSEKSILNVCLGLIAVDQGTHTVQLVRSSLQEYLLTRHESGNLILNGYSDLA
jgi:hypothetical protein